MIKYYTQVDGEDSVHEGNKKVIIADIYSGFRLLDDREAEEMLDRTNIDNPLQVRGKGYLVWKEEE